MLPVSLARWIHCRSLRSIGGQLVTFMMHYDLVLVVGLGVDVSMDFARRLPNYGQLVSMYICLSLGRESP